MFGNEELGPFLETPKLILTFFKSLILVELGPFLETLKLILTFIQIIDIGYRAKTDEKNETERILS